MTLAKLTVPGGIQTDKTDYASGPVWVDGNKVRFQQGFPEPIGGWVKETTFTFTGTASDAIAWQDLSGNNCLAVGSEKKLELVFNDLKFDITPIRATNALSAPFDTTSGSAIVTVTDVGHAADLGDYIVVDSASAVGGITIDGEYVITAVVDGDQYTITHSGNASSTANGGGSPNIVYLLGTGSSVASSGLGWGASKWDVAREGSPSETNAITGITRANPGVVTATSNTLSNGDLVKIIGVSGMTQVNGNTYTVANQATNSFELSGINTSAFTAYTTGGTATTQIGWGTPASAETSGVALEPDLWSFDLWGEDLIATRRGGSTYQWDASVGTATRATIITNAPTTAMLNHVSLPDRHLVLFGAHDGSNNDPLLVRWSDQENNTSWTASATNTAGSQRLDKGTKIMSAIHVRDQTLILTDDSVFGMNFQGPPYTFAFRHLASGCGPISQHCLIELDGVAVWMGCRHFHYFDGTVKTLPSPVRDHVFNNLSSEGALVTYGGKNRGFNEAWWFYATGTNTVPDSYVTFNMVTREWAIGTLDRTVWLDEISWLTSPVAVDGDGNLYYHETGVSADGDDLAVSIESGVFELPAGPNGGSGENLMLIDKFIPDWNATPTGTMVSASPNLTVSFHVRKYPNAPETTKGPFSINAGASTTEKISIRAKGRQMRFGYASSGQATYQLGHARINLIPDGNPGS